MNTMQFRPNATSQRSLGTGQADPKMYKNDFTMAKTPVES